MKIKKGNILKVDHHRKGTFMAKATEDFDTDKKEFYPIVTLEVVYGAANNWVMGEKIPCRASLCSVSKVKGYQKEG